MILSFITMSIKGVLTMKKTVITIISIILGIALVFSLAMLIRNYIVPVLTIANSQKNVQETFLCSSESPDDKFNLEAYRTEPGATVDYSVRVYMINGNQKEIIYNAYHESEAKIDWVDNTTVSINGKTLDMSSGETYDWRKE